MTGVWGQWGRWTPRPRTQRHVCGTRTRSQRLETRPEQTLGHKLVEVWVERPSMSSLPGPRVGAWSPSLRQWRSLDESFLSLTYMEWAPGLGWWAKAGSQAVAPASLASSALPGNRQSSKQCQHSMPRAEYKLLCWPFAWMVMAQSREGCALGDRTGLLSSGVSLSS